MRQLDPCTELGILCIARLVGDAGLIPAERDSRAKRRVLGKAVIVTQVRAVEFRSVEHAEHVVLALTEHVVRAKAEQGQPIVRSDVVGDPRFVVAVVELYFVHEQRQHRAGVRIAKRGQCRAAVAVETGLHERTEIDQADVVFAVELLAGCVVSPDTIPPLKRPKRAGYPPGTDRRVG